MNKKIKRFKAFTLIELILYIALVSIFMTGAVYFTWDVVYGREKAIENQIVEQNATIAINRIGYEIERAKDIQVNQTQLVLDNNGSTTTIELNGDRLELSTDGITFYFLTSNQVKITNTDVFTDLGTSDSNSKNIKVRLIIEQSQQTIPGQPVASTEIESAFELNGQFNEAGELLSDLTQASVNGLNIEGIVLESSSLNTTTIDKMNITWSGLAGTENITNVQINGGAEEWSGSSPSDSVIDINNVSFSSSDGTIPVDYLTFDSNMDGAIIDVGFVMLDGSTAWSEIDLSTSATPSASPTSSPVPSATPVPTNSPVPSPSYTTCIEYCQGNSYSSGSCEKNAGACNSSGFIYLGGGDQYCTGGPNADTCCCF